MMMIALFKTEITDQRSPKGRRLYKPVISIWKKNLITRYKENNQLINTIYKIGMYWVLYFCVTKKKAFF